MNLGPIHVPYKYNEQDTTEQKVIFALGQIGEGTAAEVVTKLKQVNPNEEVAETEATAILKDLYDQGLIKAENNQSQLSYNLSKIVKPNAGKTDLNGIEDIS
jgi:predicted transcriptional regulator